MKRLRVLHIYRTYFPEYHGGAQEAIRQFALATQGFAVESAIFALAKNPHPGEIDFPEGRVTRSRSIFEVASCDFGGPQAISRCRQLAAEADILHVYYPWPFVDLMLPFIRQGKPMVLTYMSDVVRQRWLDVAYAPLRARLLGSADIIAPTSPAYARSSPVLQRYAGKIRVVPHCLGDAKAPERVLVDKWRRQFGQDFFLFVGVLRYYKGLEFLVRAAAQVDRPVVILGDGPERGRLGAMAAESGCANLHFAGALPDADKFALFALCRAVVFPSHLRSEAFGITLLEGARAGKPLISCEIGTGTSWINLDGENGIVIPPADIGALVEAMNRLSRDDELCMRMSAASKARWQMHFSQQVVGQELRCLYDDLIQTSSAANSSEDERVARVTPP